MSSEAPIKVTKVFVPGGKPTITYVPRAARNLESRLAGYLDARHKVLSISGPTKTGKTVLLKSAAQGAIWLSGGAIESLDDFWAQLAESLGLAAETSLDGHLSQTEAMRAGGGVSLGVEGKYEGEEQITRGRAHSTVKRFTPRDAVRRHLLDDPESAVVVVDDFHYIPPTVQLSIARGMKDLVFDGVGFIVAAVPHRAYDVVRVEKEMTGRVDQLEVGFWDDFELRQIPAVGFEALNLEADRSTVDRLVRECFQSPHLMQEFCLKLCESNGIKARQESLTKLQEPEWSWFFQSLAPGASKTAFDLLARGPRQRTDRKPRTLVDGSETDIYGAVLRAIAKTGPLTELTYEQLRGALRDVLSDDAPQRHEVTRVLEEMSKIAKEQIDGEPVVDYDSQMATLHISDPYFAFWLRWGTHQATTPTS